MRQRLTVFCVAIVISYGCAFAQLLKTSPPPSTSASPTRMVKGARSSKAPIGQLVTIKLQDAPAAALDPAIAKALEEQSAQATAERTAAGAGAQGSARVTTASSRPLLLGNSPSPAVGPSQTQAAGMVGGGPSAKMTRAPQPISACRFGTGMAIESVSGKQKGIAFTPDPGKGPNPANQYTIRGCNFGPTQGKGEVHLFGGFVNHTGVVRLRTDFWSDNLIVATFDPSFEDEYDLENVTLVVTAASGQQVQLQGNRFVAARASRLLPLLPPTTQVKYEIKPGPESPFSHPDVFVISPVSNSNPLTAGKLYPSDLQTARQQHWTAVLGEDMKIKEYPAYRYAWYVDIDFSKLRRSFALDSNIQGVRVGFPDLDTSSGIWISEGSCQFDDLGFDGRLHGGMLHLQVLPMECDANGKFAWAHYALILSVTGPKGDKLNPWADAL